jgi:hypothetical protein
MDGRLPTDVTFAAQAAVQAGTVGGYNVSVPLERACRCVTTMIRTARPCLRVVPLLCFLASLPWAAAQTVHGQVDALGFQAGGNFVLRAGQWFPVRVSLSAAGGQVFAGELRFESIDLDGDRVAYTQPSVTLSGGAGPPKRFWCYATCNATNELPANVELLSQDGTLTELPLPAQPPLVISNDDLLVLDLSYPAVTALRTLETPSGDTPRFYRDVIVAALPPGDLPDRWWGLEAVDVIVWDQPDPAALSLPQRDALLDWVRSGGQLVLGIGAQWAALQKSDLAPLLPLQGAGPTVEVRKLTAFFDRVASPTWTTRQFPSPIAATTAQPAADAFKVLGDYGPAGPLWLVTMRLVGAGRVTATAAGLRDLTTGVQVDEAKFFGALFDLNTFAKDFADKQSQTNQYAGLLDRNWLYEGVVQPIGFRAAGALRNIVALLFVVGYIVLATVQSWSWLRKRGLTHLSWTVFAGFAVGASAFSLAAVSALRSLSGGVRSVSVLAFEAGSSTAQGPCLFGYRSPTRQRVQLTLAGDGDFLRPLAPDPKGASRYVTPARYAGIPTRATLDDLLMRATLKQVAGYWHGQLGGTIRGDLVVERRTGRLTPASWIANDLGVELAGGYLLFIDPRQDEAGLVPCRAAGLTSLYALPESEGGVTDAPPVPPAMNVLAVQIGRIPAGERIERLGAAEYEKVDANRVSWARNVNRQRSEMLNGNRDLPTLWHAQQSWAARGARALLHGGLDAPERMLLLASTRNFYLDNANDDFKTVGVPLSTDGLPSMDVTDWLLRGQAVLIAWSPTPGPARLLRNDRPLEALGGLTLYRVRIPLYYAGNPPHAAADASGGGRS